MNDQDVTRRILNQRRQRFPNLVPGLPANAAAYCRLDGPEMRIGFAMAPAGGAPGLVTAVVRYCVQRGLGIHWSVIPSHAGEEELAPALLAQAFREDESQRLMAHQGPLAAAPNPRLTIAPIRSWQEMVAYEHGSRAMFFDDPDPLPALVERRAHERMEEQNHGWCRYLGAHLEGHLVGGCYYTRWEDVPTIMGVYALPAARRRGVATTLLAQAIGDMMAAGSATCCLYVHHGNPAEQLYEHLGFVRLLDDVAFVRTSGWA
jgi:GNAT superfamily N-acetyltransferase